MMKTIKLLLAGLLLALPFSGYAQNNIYGDVNGDNEVNIADVNAVISVILGDYHAMSPVGKWLSEYVVAPDGKHVIPEKEAVVFDLYANNKGQYSYYAHQTDDHMTSIGLTWEQQAERLFIWYDDGDKEELFFRIDEHGYLLLALDRQFTTYTAYYPVPL